MHTAIKSVVLASLVGALAAGCAANTDDNDATTETSEIRASQNTLAQLGARTTVFDGAVAWRYRDMIGRGIVEDRILDGHIKVELLGDAVDAFTKVWWQATPVASKYHPAVVTIDLPVLERPNLAQHVELLIGFQIWEPGKLVSSVVIDAQAQGAVAAFLSAYAPVTKTLTPKVQLGPHLAGFALNLKTDANGDVSPDPEARGASGISRSLKKANAALHTYTIHLVPNAT
jgi:hypothetical protein